MTQNTDSAAPVTDLLRRTIVECNVPLLVIERETGVKRASIMRFLRGERSLRLDKVDALAVYLGLKLVKHRNKAMSAAEGMALELARKAIAKETVVCEMVGDDKHLGIGWFTVDTSRAEPELAAFKGRLNEMKLKVTAAIIDDESSGNSFGCAVIVEAGSRFLSEMRRELKTARYAVQN